MNPQKSYSLTRIILHWLIAAVVIGLFASGYWMVELDYYSSWYTKAPFAHKAVGVLLFIVLLAASLIRLFTSKPEYDSSLSRIEKLSAKAVQYTMSLLVYSLIITGYLITTAKGDAINVFGLFEIPAIFSDINSQNDLAGKLHRWGAYLCIALAVLHACAALFHHFIKKDTTLTRMLGK